MPSNDPRDLATDRIRTIASQCVQCGLCLPHCPSYAIGASETESPRGRLALMGQLATDVTALESAPSLDRCLACGRCEIVCPSKVPYLEALSLTRRHLVPNREHWSGRFARWMANSPGLRKRLPTIAIKARRLLPGSFRRRMNLDGMAAIGADSPRPQLAFETTRTILLAGCCADAFERRAMIAIDSIGRIVGRPVVVDRERCCGALDEHLGHGTPPAELNLPDKALLSINSGCRSRWRAIYGNAAVQGIAAWLDESAAAAGDRIRSRACRVVLHLPCTQQADPDEVAALHRLIGRIPDATMLRLPAQPGCCGAAGSFFLNQPEVSQSLAGTMAGQIQSLKPDVVLSTNGACRAQLAQALFDTGTSVRVMHPAEWLFESLRTAAT